MMAWCRPRPEIRDSAPRTPCRASRRIADSTGSSEVSINGAQTEIRNVAQLLQTTLQATVQQWENYERRFKGVDDSLGLVLDRIIQSVQENLEALSAFVEKIDEKMQNDPQFARVVEGLMNQFR